MIVSSIALLCVAGFLKLHADNLLSNYGTGFVDQIFNDNQLRDKILLIYKWRDGAAYAGAIVLICALLGIGVEKPKSKE
jgi:hypothetical protein